MCRLHLNFSANEKLSKTNPTLSQTDYDAGQFFSDLIFFFFITAFSSEVSICGMFYYFYAKCIHTL